MANESIKVIVNNNSIRNGVTNDYKLAICEYLWNGFDAGATQVELNYSANEIGSITYMSIVQRHRARTWQGIQGYEGKRKGAARGR